MSSIVSVPRALIDAELRRRATIDQAQPEGERLRLRDFIRAMWRHVDPKRFIPNWHIDAVCAHLEAVTDGQFDKLIINEPPGYAKSKVCSVGWPAWEWGPAGKPETRWLCVSYGGSDDAPALRDAQQMRQLILSPWYQTQWSPNFTLSEDQNAKSFFRNDKHGYRVSAGLEGAISGQRADKILIDDPSKLDDALSLVALKKPQDVWEHTLRTRTIDDGSAVVVIMQRLHEEDLTGYLLKEDGWTLLRLPAFYEPDLKCKVFLNGKLFFEDPRKVEGQPLHPLMTKAVADATVQSRTRPDLYVGQQQQRPSSAEGTMIKKAWVKRWVTLPHTLDENILTVDCAFKDSKDNSWVVFQAWGRREANAYLLGQYREHMDLPATLDALQVFASRYPKCTGKYVESKANGVGVVQMLRNKLPGLIGTDDDEEVLKLFCSGSKEAKLQAVAPYFHAGNVWIAPEGDRWDGSLHSTVAEYEHELTTFPKTRFNDQVDATSMGVWKLLHSYEAHVPATEVFAVDEGNVTPLTGMFDLVYGERENAAYDITGLASLGRDAYGR